MAANLWPFLIYWLALFIACYTVVEFGQDQLYDEVTPYAGLKVGAGSMILAALMTWLRPSFETMFTTAIAWTALQGIVWFIVFTLIFQFHPPHALGIGLLTMALVSGVATMGVESLTKPSPALTPVRELTISKPVRRSLGPAAPPPKAQEKAK